MAMGQNLYHIWVDEHPFTSYFDVHGFDPWPNVETNMSDHVKTSKQLRRSEWEKNDEQLVHMA